MKSERLSGNIGTVCVMGLSSAGKSTLAKLLVKRFRDHGFACALIDGDQVRHLFDERYGYDPASRRAQSRRLLKLAGWIEHEQIIPVVAMIHPFEDDRVLFRERLHNYYQIYLECDVEECTRRDSRDGKGVYSLSERSDTPQVVGLDIPFDPVNSADIVLSSKDRSPEELVEIVWEDLQKSFFPKARKDAVLSPEMDVLCEKHSAALGRRMAR